MRRYPQTEAGGPVRNGLVDLTQMERPNLRSDRGQANLDPAGVTPSRRQGTLGEKRRHWNQYTQSPTEGEGHVGSIRNSRPNSKHAHNPRESKVAHPRQLAKQQKKPGEDGYW